MLRNCSVNQWLDLNDDNDDNDVVVPPKGSLAGIRDPATKAASAGGWKFLAQPWREDWCHSTYTAVISKFSPRLWSCRVSSSIRGDLLWIHIAAAEFVQQQHIPWLLTSALDGFVCWTYYTAARGAFCTTHLQFVELIAFISDVTYVLSFILKLKYQ